MAAGPAAASPAEKATPWHVDALGQRFELRLTCEQYRLRDHLLVEAMPSLVGGDGAAPTVRVYEPEADRWLPAQLRDFHLLVRLPGRFGPFQTRRLLVYFGRVAGDQAPVGNPGPPWPADAPLPGRNLLLDSGFATLGKTAAAWQRLPGPLTAGVKLRRQVRPDRGGAHALIFDSEPPDDANCRHLVQSAPFAIKPGQSLQFGLWASTLRLGGTSGVMLRVYDAKGAHLRKPRGDRIASAVPLRSDGWQPMRGTFVVPPGMTTGRLRIIHCRRSGSVAFADAWVRIIDHLTPVTAIRGRTELRP